MEQEELINEKKNLLFEQIKSEYAAMARNNRVFFWIFCVFFGIFLIQEVLLLTGVIEDFGAKELLSYFIFYVALFVSVLYSMMATNKMAKADTPEGLLVTYDKIKTIGVWTCVVALALFVTSAILKDGLSKANILTYILLSAIFIALIINCSRKNKIRQLRELVQKS